MKDILYLHIGSHKTGSTSIQRNLFLNREHLISYGVSLFCKGLDGKDRVQGNLHPWIKCSGKCFRMRQGGEVKDLTSFVGFMSDLPCKKVVASSEMFSWLFSGREIARLAKALRKEFKEIKIICYLRRQDLQAVSHYQQASKVKNSPSNNFYNGSGRALPEACEYYEDYFDYDKRISLWEKQFGRDNITLRVFERPKLKNEDVVSDFLHLIDVPDFPNIRQFNESNGFERTKIGHLLNRTVQNGSELNHLLRRSTDNTEKSQPSRSDAEEFYAHFKGSNRKLNSRYKLSSNLSPFTEDFSGYPEQSRDLWDEGSANAAISHLLSAVNSAYADISSSDLYNAAQALLDTDPTMAKKFLQAALHLKPASKKYQLLMDRLMEQEVV